MNAEELDRKFRKSLELLTATVPLEKIFLQVSDACKVDPPLDKEPDKQGLRSRGRWSHIGHCHTTVGILPVTEVTKAVLGTGFRGWFSIEVFDGQGLKKYPDDMGPYAKKAVSSLERLLEDARL
jgi:sugar phosphate isomerase/epimerase